MASTEQTPSDQIIETLAQRLENLTSALGNVSAEEYMAGLNVYTRQLSIIRTWPRPPGDLPLDSSEGVVWVIIIPALYFLVVATILGALVAFIWYKNIWEHKAIADEAAGDETNAATNTTSLNNRIYNINNNNNNNNSGNNDKNLHKNTPNSFVRAGVGKSETAIDSIVRASLTSRGSGMSINVFDTKTYNTPRSQNEGYYETKSRIPYTSTTNPLPGDECKFRYQSQCRYSDNTVDNDNGDEDEITGNRTSVSIHHHHHNQNSPGNQHHQLLHNHRHNPTPPPHQHHLHHKPNPHRSINISLASPSLRSDDDDGDFNDTYDNEDRFSRDSLRTSMESQKLLATGVVEIAPDDLYSMSDNTAYTGDDDDNDDDDKSKNDNKSFRRRGIRRSTKSSHHEICATSGVENPSFQIEIGDVNNERQFLEDPMGYLVDHSQELVERNDSRFFGHVNNTSSVSVATNFQTSSIFGRPNSNSESFTSSSPSIQDPFGSNPPANINHVFGSIDSQNVRRGTGSNPRPFGGGDADLVRTNQMGVVALGVGGALPPLPPNHYPRQQQMEAPGGPQLQTGPRQEGPSGSYSSRRADQSFLDTSSVLDSSNESGNLSLPSSIARFHSSRVQPRLQPCGEFPLTNAHNDTPILFADWSPCRRRPEMTSTAGHVTSDNFSMCPNRGSFNHSFEESKANAEAGSSGPTKSFYLEYSEDDGEREAVSRGEEWEVDKRSEDFVTGESSCDAEVGVYGSGCGGEVGGVEAGLKRMDEDSNGRLGGDSERSGEIIQSDKNPRMRRMMSLDWLRSGKVSVEKRLRGFGYVKSKGKNTYVETEKLAE